MCHDDPHARGSAAALLACALAAVASTAPAPAATSSTVVGATVPSATTLDVAGCPSAATDLTSFGIVTPGTSIRTSLDCAITFGSSNDTARLRIAQQDATGTSMNRVTWLAGTTGTGAEFRRVDMVDTSIGYAVANARVLKTTDGGANWSIIDIVGDGDPIYWGVRAIDADTAWISGAGGAIRQTTDGGVNWTQFAAGATTDTLDEIDVQGQDIVAAGANGTVVYSHNGGTTWTVGTSCSCDNNTVLVRENGHVLTGGTNAAQGVRRSTDGGATWSSMGPSGEFIESIDEAPDGTIWLGGSNGRVARSSNGGTTWSIVSVPATSTQLEGVLAFDSRTAVVVGRTPSGAWITHDAGATWTPVSSGATTDLKDVGGVSIDRLVMVGAGGAVRRLAQDNPVPDFAAGTADWTTGTNVFGACLATVGGGAFTDGTTWTRDLVGTAGDCLASNAEPWNGIGTTPSAIALVPSTTTTGTAALRFGLRTASSQAPGDYLAHLRLEVVAPA